MAGNGTISITFKLDGDSKGFKAIARDANGLRTIMHSTLEQSEALKTSLVNWSAAVQGLQSVDRAVSQISSQLNAITSESLGFSKAMREANTMASKDAAGFKQLKSEVAELAKEIPIARDLLANGLYQTISNGVPEDNWIEYLKTSARSAVGGLADINKVVGVTSTIIKNYGLQWSAAADIQDKIQLTAKNGVTTFEQLAESLPTVAGNAAVLGVSVNELMGSFATLTGVSGNTAEVSTQLAAIFSSLVKPSSDAAKMAGEMGIQFDAAAITAAGGFRQFLVQLDRSVKEYSAASGVLEQEVYGRLFGSARAIRALIPLQGELADKFAENVANMENSAGTMSAAYEEMASTGGAVNQMLRNQWAAVIDVVAGVTSAAQPYINFTSGLLSTGSSAAILITTFKQLNIQQALVAARAKVANVAMIALGLRGRSAAAVIRVFGSSMRAGAVSATALKIALRGLAMATGVGAVITGLAILFEKLTNSANSAAEATEKAANAGKGLNFKGAAAVASEGYDTTEVREGESYEDRIARLREAMNKNSARIKEIAALAASGKIVTEAQGQQALAERRSLIAQNKRLKEAIKQAQAKQQKEQGVVITATRNVPAVKGKPDKAEAPRGSLADISKRISDIKAKIQLEVDANSRVALYKELQGLERKKRIIEFNYQFPEHLERPKVDPAKGLFDLKVETNIEELGDLKPALENINLYLESVGKKTKASMAEAASAVGELAGAFSGLADALELPELNVAGTIAQAIANMILAFSQAQAAAASLGPWAWIGFGAAGLAQLAATVSAVKGMAKFADGGIVSGPTVGLIGEYAGASNNPEVIAPLDKLRGMLNPAGEPVIIGGTLRASGREIICVLANETRIASKSGKRTNINI